MDRSPFKVSFKSLQVDFSIFGEMNGDSWLPETQEKPIYQSVQDNKRQYKSVSQSKTVAFEKFWIKMDFYTVL